MCCKTRMLAQGSFEPANSWACAPKILQDDEFNNEMMLDSCILM